MGLLDGRGRVLIGSVEIGKLNTSSQKPERLLIPSSHSHSEKPKAVCNRQDSRCIPRTREKLQSLSFYWFITLYVSCVCTCMLSHVWSFATPWTVTPQAPLSMRFSRQEYWSGLPFPSPGDLPDPGVEPASPVSPALAGRFFITEQPGKLQFTHHRKFSFHS